MSWRVYSHLDGAELSQFSNLLKVRAWLSVWIVPLISKRVLTSLTKGTLGKDGLNQPSLQPGYWYFTLCTHLNVSAKCGMVSDCFIIPASIKLKGDQSASYRSSEQQLSLQRAARQLQCCFMQTNTIILTSVVCAC